MESLLLLEERGYDEEDLGRRSVCRGKTIRTHFLAQIRVFYYYFKKIDVINYYFNERFDNA